MDGPIWKNNWKRKIEFKMVIVFKELTRQRDQKLNVLIFSHNLCSMNLDMIATEINFAKTDMVWYALCTVYCIGKLLFTNSAACQRCIIGKCIKNAEFKFLWRARLSGFKFFFSGKKILDGCSTFWTSSYRATPAAF